MLSLQYDLALLDYRILPPGTDLVGIANDVEVINSNNRQDVLDRGIDKRKYDSLNTEQSMSARSYHTGNIKAIRKGKTSKSYMLITFLTRYPVADPYNYAASVPRML